MTKPTLEYCKKCLDNKCWYHKWFTDKQPKTEQEVLIVCLEQIKERLFQVFEKVYLVENVIHDWGKDIHVGGKLVFGFGFIPHVHKKDDICIPLDMYSHDEKVISYDIEAEVILMRHHPTDLVIKKDMFAIGEMHRITLIDFNDSLHCESIQDYPKIVKLAKKRLKEFIDSIR